MNPDPVAPITPPLSFEARSAWLHLANLQFTPRLNAALLRAFHNDPQAIFAATDAELEAVPDLQPRNLVRLRDPELAVTPRQLVWLERPDVHIFWNGHPGYPRLLRSLPDPPPILFVRGVLDEPDRFGVGIVGSRHATPYGRSVTERFGRELAGYGLTVVSGGATGIDTAAHRGALAAGGRTLAVLGCGIDIDYPRENRQLFEQIAANGALISEYALGTPPEAWRFPARNRIISGLSQGVLVVEAGRTSGALITARCAAEQGRPVMAVPGNIDRPASEGANGLLKDGATLVTETEDILRALGMVVLPARPEHQRALDLEWDGAGTSQAEMSPPDEEGGRSGAAGNRSPARRLPSLPLNQQRLLDELSLTPRHIDTISQATGLTATEAGVEMTLLELQGYVRRLPGNNYIRTL
jgi:DNA processing protein